MPLKMQVQRPSKGKFNTVKMQVQRPSKGRFNGVKMQVQRPSNARLKTSFNIRRSAFVVRNFLILSNTVKGRLGCWT